MCVPLVCLNATSRDESSGGLARNVLSLFFFFAPSGLDGVDARRSGALPLLEGARGTVYREHACEARGRPQLSASGRAGQGQAKLRGGEARLEPERREGIPN